jgi:hypothetical protein
MKWPVKKACVVFNLLIIQFIAKISSEVVLFSVLKGQDFEIRGLASDLEWVSCLRLWPYPQGLIRQGSLLRLLVKI